MNPQNENSILMLHQQTISSIQIQTGLIQGSAGVAFALLHTWMVTKGKDYLVHLPDNLF